MIYGTVPYHPQPISRIVLGIMPLPANDLEHSFAMLDRYRELGGNVIDNSPVYGMGKMELMRAYYEARGEDALVRLDKGCHHSAENDAGRRVSKAALDADVETNLKGQGVSYSDFFVLHRDDPRVPVREIMEWLNEHRDAGRIRAFGGSNWHHSRIEEANEYAEAHGLQAMSLSSPNLSLATVNEPMWWEALTIDGAGRDWHERTGFPLFAWSSAGGGFFAGVKSPSVERVYENPVNQARLRRSREIGASYGITPYQVALAWTLSQPLNVFALIGPDTLEQLEMNMHCVNVRLTPEELRYLEHG